MGKLGSVMAVVVASCVLCGCGQRTVVVADGESANTITVNASSEVKVVPDKATINVRCESSGKTAEEAQDAGATQVNAVLESIRAAGVDEKDIQTEHTSVSPRYDWSDDGDGSIVGYDAYTHIVVSSIDIDAVGPLMDSCLSAGATGVDGPTYYASNYDEAYAQALSEAVEASKPKAEAIAKAAGSAVGEVVSVTEGYQDTGLRYEEKALMNSSEDADAGAAMEIAPGEVSVEAQVSVVYAIGA